MNTFGDGVGSLSWGIDIDSGSLTPPLIEDVRAGRNPSARPGVWRAIKCQPWAAQATALRKAVTTSSSDAVLYSQLMRYLSCALTGTPTFSTCLPACFHQSSRLQLSVKPLRCVGTARCAALLRAGTGALSRLARRENRGGSKAGKDLQRTRLEVSLLKW